MPTAWVTLSPTWPSFLFGCEKSPGLSSLVHSLQARLGPAPTSRVVNFDHIGAVSLAATRLAPAPHRLWSGLETASRDWPAASTPIRHSQSEPASISTAPNP